MTHPRPSPTTRKALVTGHFSTVGDLEVLGHVLDRLRAEGVAFAVSPYRQELVSMDPAWVDAATLDPATFTHLIVVCGPYAAEYRVKYPVVLERFRHCVHVGVNLTMVAPLDVFNPFDALIERDSDRIVRPDLSFLRSVPRVPVVGLCLVRSQREYGERALHDQAAARLRDLLVRAGVAVVPMDTTVPRQENRVGIGSESEFESICARLDAVVTNRLHGTVLALKNGIPVLAVDAIAGGDKVTRQAEMLDWPEIVALDSVTDEALDEALRRCLAPEARGRAMACAARARDLLAGHDALFAVALEAEARPDRRPPVTGRKRLSQLAARYRHWKRLRFPARR